MSQTPMDVSPPDAVSPRGAFVPVLLAGGIGLALAGTPIGPLDAPVDPQGEAGVAAFGAGRVKGEAGEVVVAVCAVARPDLRRRPIHP